MISVDSELSPIIERIARASGFRCDAYKESCFRRRLAVRMRATGVDTFAGYAQVLDGDDAELQRFMSVLTINVTGFYRNPETFDRLRSDVLPRLRQTFPGPLSVWSAGCASGEEAFTLAMLLAESDRLAGTAESMVWGSDLDTASLKTAETALFPADRFDTLPPEFVTSFTEPAQDGRVVVADRVRRMVRFGAADLLRDAAPCTALHLILCRNVVIYFDRDFQETLFARMADALLPGGFLILGKTETMMGNVRSRFELDDVRERVYRRP